MSLFGGVREFCECKRDVCDCNKLITSEMDDLRVENRHLYYLILQLILDLDELEDACNQPSSPRAPSKKHPNHGSS